MPYVIEAALVIEDGNDTTYADREWNQTHEQVPPAVDYGMDVEYVVGGVVIPLIGAAGVIGNLLNLLILTWRYNKKEVDVLEKGSLLGLIALAVSDMLFCLLILPHAFYYQQRTIFYEYSFRLYYQMYSLYLKNAFIKISTWLTLVVGLARYIAICHPLRARRFIAVSGMRWACCLTYVFWLAFMSPMLWTYEIHNYPSASNHNFTSLIIDMGHFSRDTHLNHGFAFTWSLIGYLIPVAVLAVCNVSLIRALRKSVRLRRLVVRRAKNHMTAGTGSSSASPTDVSVRVTLTLVVLIAMFMLLVSPSEILSFLSKLISEHQYRSFELAVVFTNLLQAVNFAFHFVMYCSVNVTFRRTVATLACKVAGLCYCWRHRREKYFHTALQADAASSSKTELNVRTPNGCGAGAGGATGAAEKPRMHSCNSYSSTTTRVNSTSM